MLKRNLIANYLGQGWSALMSLAFIPLYIKYLGIEAYGVIGLFAVLQAWLALLDMGMTPTLNREMARFTGGAHDVKSIRDILRTIEVFALVLAVVIVIGVWGSSGWLAGSWLKADQISYQTLAESLSIMGVVAALRFLEGVYRSSIVGLQRQVFFNVTNSFMVTLRSVGAVAVLAWWAPTTEAFFIWQGIVSFATVLVLALATYGVLPRSGQKGSFSIKAFNEVRHFAGGMVGITFLALLLTQMDKILLSKLLSLEEFGVYMLASAVSGALYMLIGPITQAFFPKFCELHTSNDADTLTRYYHKSSQLVSVTAGSAGIILILFSEAFLNVWTHDSELAAKAAPILSLLALGTLLNGLMWVPYQTQLAHGWTSLAVRSNILAVLCIVPAILWSVPKFGVMGAAWSWVALNSGYLLINIFFMHRRIMIGESWRWYIFDLSAPLLAALLAGIIVKFCFSFLPGLFIVDVFEIIFASFACVSISGMISSHVRAEFLLTMINVYRKIKICF